MERRGNRDTPLVDLSVQAFEMRLRHQQHVEHVFERERKRERQRELEDAHAGAARHQPQMRPDVAEKPHQCRARNETVEDSREKPAATLVGFVGSASRLPGGTIHRLRRTGDYSRTTIWHAAEFSSRASARKYVNFLAGRRILNRAGRCKRTLTFILSLAGRGDGRALQILSSFLTRRRCD